LCHHPEVQKKASAEIDGFVARHGCLPTFKERDEVPYCVSVIKECIRYRPTGPFGVPHAASEDSKCPINQYQRYAFY
jgi:cytochrome P450